MNTRLGLAAAIVAAVLALSGCMRMDAHTYIYEDSTTSAAVSFGFSDSFITLSGEDPEAFVDEMLFSADFDTMMAEFDAVGLDVEISRLRENGYSGFTMTQGRMPIDDLNEISAQSYGAAPIDLSREGDHFIYRADGLAADDDPQLQAMLEDPSLVESFEMTMTITFPGDVISTTIGTASGPTVSYTLQDVLENPGEIVIEAWAIPHSGSSLMPIILIVAGLVVVGGSIAIVLANRRRSQPLPPPVGHPAFTPTVE